MCWVCHWYAKAKQRGRPAAKRFRDDWNHLRNLALQEKTKEIMKFKEEEDEESGEFMCENDIVMENNGSWTNPLSLEKLANIKESCLQLDPEPHTGEWIRKHPQTKMMTYKVLKLKVRKRIGKRNQFGTRHSSGMLPNSSPEKAATPLKKRVRMTPKAKVTKKVGKPVDLTSQTFKKAKDICTSFVSARNEIENHLTLIEGGGKWKFAQGQKQTELTNQKAEMKKHMNDFHADICKAKSVKDFMKLCKGKNDKVDETTLTFDLKSFADETGPIVDKSTSMVAKLGRLYSAENHVEPTPGVKKAKASA